MTTHNLPPHSILHNAIEDAKAYTRKTIDVKILIKVLIADLRQNHQDIALIFDNEIDDIKVFYYHSIMGYIKPTSAAYALPTNKEEAELLRRAFETILSPQGIKNKARDYMKIMGVDDLTVDRNHILTADRNHMKVIVKL